MLELCVSRDIDEVKGIHLFHHQAKVGFWERFLESQRREEDDSV